MRRRAQGAIEYLFMVAAALIIVAIVIKYLRTAARETGQTISSAANKLNIQIKSELSSALK